MAPVSGKTMRQLSNIEKRVLLREFKVYSFMHLGVKSTIEKKLGLSREGARYFTKMVTEMLNVNVIRERVPNRQPADSSNDGGDPTDAGNEDSDSSLCVRCQYKRIMKGIEEENEDDDD